MATRTEYAQASLATYHSGDGSAPAGWTQISYQAPTSTGFSATAYQTTTGEIVIAYAGTQSSGAGFSNDAVNDIEMLLDETPGQYNEALAFYNSVKSANSAAAITLTGQSLGGSLAQLVGAETGVNTFSYNSVGVEGLLDDCGITNTDFTKITNYSLGNDIANIGNISLGLNQIGTTYIIPSSGKDPINAHNDFLSLENSAAMTQSDWISNNSLIYNLLRNVGTNLAGLLGAYAWEDLCDMFGLDSINGYLLNQGTDAIKSLVNLFHRGMQGFETTCSNQVIDYTERPDTSLTTVSEQGLIITPSIAAEPNILGSDALLGLQNAMAADTTGELQNLVDSYKNTVSNNQTLDFSNRTVTVDNIIKKWTGSDTIEAGSAGEYVDAQKLNAVEKFMAEKFVNHNDILGEGAASYIDSIYDQIHKMIDSQLMLQTNLKDISDLITISYDSTIEKLTYDYSAVITAIQNAISTDAIAGKNLLSEFTYAMYGVGLDKEIGFSTFYNIFATLGEDYRNILDIARVYTGTTVDIINGTASL